MKITPLNKTLLSTLRPGDVLLHARNKRKWSTSKIYLIINASEQRGNFYVVTSPPSRINGNNAFDYFFAGRLDYVDYFAVVRHS